VKRAAFALGLVAGALALAAAAWSAPPPSVSEKDGIAAFETVKTVLQNPRCQNCHIPGDAPLQFDAGLPHQQNVLRGVDGFGSAGLKCSTCHGTENPPASYGPRVPPGAPGWRLPPAEHKMIFIGLSSGELCRGLKDMTGNGGKDLAALTKHVDSDGLVLWGWSPGAGRDAVPVPHAEFVAKFKQWVAAGAPCAAP
jgi:hypothetical protein